MKSADAAVVSMNQTDVMAKEWPPVSLPSPEVEYRMHPIADFQIFIY